MKKSKVLIPAMALLLFSTAASITGTVAWFTSTRVFTTEAGQFEVAQLDGNLDVTLSVTDCIGTSLRADGKAIVVNRATSRLVDTSVDLTGKAWRLNGEGGATYSDLGTANLAKWKVKTLDSVDYYAAVTWKMTITYTFASEKGDMGVYLDLNKSVFADTNDTAENTGVGDSAKGFRIMFSGGGTAATVWGNNPAELTAAPAEYSAAEASYTAGTSYVSYEGVHYKCKTTINEPSEGAGVGAFDSTKWEKTFKNSLDVASSKVNLGYIHAADDDPSEHIEAFAEYKKTVEATDATAKKGEYFTSVANKQRYDDGVEFATLKAERIATISKATADANDHVASATVTCTAWFEGTDPNIVNGTAMKAIGAAMTIYARCDSTTSA